MNDFNLGGMFPNYSSSLNLGLPYIGFDAQQYGGPSIMPKPQDMLQKRDPRMAMGLLAAGLGMRGGNNMMSGLVPLIGLLGK